MNKFIYINEIFGPTIQGEGPNIGIKTLFVRVAGCDFSCDFCDSKYAWKINNDTKKYSSEELTNIILDRCTTTHTSHVILTGGNPCLYDFTDLIQELHNHFIQVDIETQGSIFPDWITLCDLIVISPKPPSSGQIDVYNRLDSWLENQLSLPRIAIKIPIFDLVDFQFAMRYYKLIRKYSHKSINLYLSVGNTNVSEDGDISSRILMDYKKLVEVTMNSELDDVYILPQMHTLIWGNKQGV